MNLSEPTTIAFLGFGSCLVFASSLIDRLEGTQRLSGTGLEVNVGLAPRERQIAAGEVHALPPIATPEPTIAAIEGPYEARVVIANDALAELKSLDDTTRRAVYGAFTDLIQRPLTELHNVQQYRADSDERLYYVLRGLPNVRVIFRQLDKTSPDEPTRYVVLQILPSDN